MELKTIPRDWVINSLGSISNCLDNKRIPVKESDRRQVSALYPYCGANGVLGFIDDFIFDEDIILIAEDGGNFYDWEFRPIAYRMREKCWVNNHAHVITAKTELVDQGYLFYSLEHKDITSLLVGGTRAKLNRSVMDKIKIAHPENLLEQKAIAEALSDIDEFILTSRRLFSKKIYVMDSLVGELVSGKYFKKIGADFRFETIKNLGIEVKKGELITEKTAIEGEVPVIAGGVSAPYYHNTPNRTGITVTISASGANAGYVNVWKQPIWASDCSTINESSLFDVRYLYYILKGNQENIYRSQYGGAQPHVRPNEIEKLVIPWTEKGTQKEIADLLDDFSNEIKDLETSIRKYVLLKQGMMNDLLTGKVRLV